MRVTRVDQMTEDERTLAKVVFNRRSSKMEGRHFAELEFNTELYSAEGEALIIYCTDDTPPAQRAAAVESAKTYSDIVYYEFVVVPKEWLEEDRFVPGKKVLPWIEAARRVMKEGCLRVHRNTNEVIPEFKSGGVLLDHTTAHMLVTVHKAVLDMLREKIKTASPEQKEKSKRYWQMFIHFPITTAAEKCWKLVK